MTNTETPDIRNHAQPQRPGLSGYAGIPVRKLSERLSGCPGIRTQQIVDELKKAISGARAPDYMVVKTCSEIHELFRHEAGALLRQLRRERNKWGQRGEKVTSIEERKLEADFRRIHSLYWISMKAYYALYARAMNGFRSKIAYPMRGEPTSSAVAKAA